LGFGLWAYTSAFSLRTSAFQFQPSNLLQHSAFELQTF
jgi:hypothetical protein